VTQTDGVSPLVGGELDIRFNFNPIIPPPNGVETIEITPQLTSIFDIRGNPAEVTTTTGAVNLYPAPPIISTLVTADTDSDGFIDRLIVTFDTLMDDTTIVPANFSVDAGSVVSVTNDFPDIPEVIWVNLTDGVLGTDVQPSLTIAPGGIENTAATPNVLISGYPSTDGASPVILYTLAVAGEDKIYVRFSEPVSAPGGVALSNADFNYAGAATVSSVQRLDIVGNYSSEIFLILDQPVTADEIVSTGPTTDVTVLTAVEDQLTIVLATPAHRVSDIGLEVVRPVYATNETNGDVNTIRDFDGSRTLPDADTTLNVSILAPSAAAATTQLYYDANVAAAFASNGLWLPQLIQGLVPSANTEARLRNEVSAVGAVREYSILADDVEVEHDNAVEFIVDLGPILCARVNDPTDPRTLVPWSFRISGFRYGQRGGVTIVKNVINPVKGETTKLFFTLTRPGTVTVQVFDLKGDIVDVLYRGRMDTGSHSLTWDGRNRGSRIVARGIYFIKIVGPMIDETRKVLIVK
jgi:hypothetical protein